MEELSYNSAVKFGSRLDNLGMFNHICIECSGSVYNLTRGSGSTLPGAINKSSQIKFTIKPVNGHGIAEKYIVSYGIGKDGSHISSERWRGSNGTLELLGPVREADVPYLTLLSIFLAK